MSLEIPNSRSKTRKLVKIAMLALIVMPLVLFLLGQIVLHLWNWLMPVLFHLPMITFWQGLGLLVLSWMFFGGLRGSGPRSGYHRHWRRRLHEHWEEMSPEEREKFSEWLRTRSQSS